MASIIGVRPLKTGDSLRLIRLHRSRGRFVYAAASLLFWASPALGQSITRCTLTGTVTDVQGAPLSGARVQITHAATGVSRWLTTGVDGSYRLALLEPGDYDVFVEELGYRPARVRGVPLRPGQRQQLSIVLETVQLPVNEVDEASYRGLAGDSRAGMSQWFTPFETLDLPEQRRGATELGRLSTIANRALDTEGLPGWLSGVVMDGVSYSPARHPGLWPGRFGSDLFPLSDLEHAEFLSNGLDVEWSGFAAGYLSGFSRRGTRRAEVRAYGDWTGSSTTSSDEFLVENLSANTGRGGIVASGPVLPDTAHYALGFEVQHLETPLPPAWVNSVLDSGLVALARDSFGVDISAYTRDRVEASNTISGFGRFDWQVTSASTLSARANLAWFEAGGGGDRDPGLGPRYAASLGSRIEGLELSTAATLASRLSRHISQEFRFGLDRTEFDYTGTSLLATRIVDDGLAFGTDPAIPGEFDQLTARLSETLHLGLGDHQLKFGLAGSYLSAQQRYEFDRGGAFVFAGLDELAGLQGSFSSGAGTASLGKFHNWQLAAYFQDTWTATPGLDVLLGLRFEYDRLDRGSVQRNAAWFEHSGLDNTAFERSLRKWSPRIGLRWDVGDRGEWLVRGGWGLYHSLVDPALFGEVVTLDDGPQFRRGVGVLSNWPGAPDLETAPVLGARLTLLGPEFMGPQTSRASLGLSRMFPERTAVHLHGTYRYTDHLPRRRDLNLALAPSSADQHGRPVYGNLLQQGSLITVQPGSNRRFNNFDLVSAVNADGVSRYWGVTLAAERHTGSWLDVLASYTFSWTEDDWLAGHGGGPQAQLTPCPEGLNSEDWAHGTSDFDVPQRLVIGAELRFPMALAGARLAALYRFESGRPYTPGFRDGVDVNGDGSGRNDPAFIDPNIVGMESLLQKWDCLADQVGDFAERNSCRAPDVHRFDVRFAIGLYELQGQPIEIVVDALNLLDADMGVRDRALFLIDREGTLEANPDGTLTLPLVINPSFGEPLVRQANGRSFRFGVRIGL